MHAIQRTAWRDDDEFLEVYKALEPPKADKSSFAEENDEKGQAWALERIKIWHARLRPASLPHAIEATSDLAGALLLYTGQQQPAWHERQWRLLFAMAITRFVNGLVDPGQKGMYAISIAGIAQRLGLPARFVELRHAATHEELPQLELLLETASLALAWLREHYWDVVVRGIRERKAESSASVAFSARTTEGQSARRQPMTGSTSTRRSGHAEPGQGDETSGPWSMYPADLWHPCPIGLHPGLPPRS